MVDITWAVASSIARASRSMEHPRFHLVRTVDGWLGPRLDVHDDDLGLLLVIQLIPSATGEDMAWLRAELEVQTSVSRERQPYSVFAACICVAVSTLDLRAISLGSPAAVETSNLVSLATIFRASAVRTQAGAAFDAAYLALIDPEHADTVRFLDVTRPLPRTGRRWLADTLDTPAFAATLAFLVDDRNGWGID